MEELERIALTEALHEYGLKAGDIGMIVHVYGKHKGYEVAFVTLGGDLVAWGEAQPDSDLDLLVDQDWSQWSGWGSMELVVALEDLLGCHVDVATVDELKPRIREQVLTEAIAL